MPDERIPKRHGVNAPLPEATRARHLGALQASIGRVLEVGQRVPCLDRTAGPRWLSSDPDETHAAALGCRNCPALADCARYITACPEPSGVWAGTIPDVRERR